MATKYHWLDVAKTCNPALIHNQFLSNFLRLLNMCWADLQNDVFPFYRNWI